MPTRDQKAIGRELRYRLVLILAAARRPLTISDLLEALDACGHPATGRGSKTISDALRWETARGRVVRARRSTYAVGVIPPSTKRWMRTQIDRSPQRHQPPAHPPCWRCSDNPHPPSGIVATTPTKRHDRGGPSQIWAAPPGRPPPGVATSTTPALPRRALALPARLRRHLHDGR